MSKKSFQATTLNNGLRVVTDYLPGLQLASARWVLRAGSDRDIKPGTAHFLEHLLGSGHEADPNYDLGVSTKNWGASVNLSTGGSVTFASIDGLERRVLQHLTSMGNMVCRPLLAEDEIEKQRQIIRQEFLKYESDDLDIFTRARLRACYPNAPFSRPILGTLEDIMSMTRQDLIDYKDRNYLSGDMCVFVSGSIPHERAVDIVGESFDNIIVGKNQPLSTPQFNTDKSSVNIYKDSPAQKIHIVFPLSSLSEKEMSGFNTICKMLDFGLNEYLRNKKISYGSDIYFIDGLARSAIHIRYETESSQVERSFDEIRSFFERASSFFNEEDYAGMMEKIEKYNAEGDMKPDSRIARMMYYFSDYQKIDTPESIKGKTLPVSRTELDSYLDRFMSITPKVFGMGPRNDLPSFRFNNSTSLPTPKMNIGIDLK
ncbi:MAG: insulinase family protein [Alphaproteobacteria bacterium]|nr:insulinase family protein [Alphaproteobacteria bacterium]